MEAFGKLRLQRFRAVLEFVDPVGEPELAVLEFFEAGRELLRFVVEFGGAFVQPGVAFVKVVGARDQFALDFVEALRVRLTALGFTLGLEDVARQFFGEFDGFRELRVGRRQGGKFVFEFLRFLLCSGADPLRQVARAVDQPTGAGLRLFLAFGDFFGALFEFPRAVVQSFGSL